MQLDKFTDYALRVLLALEAHSPKKLSSTAIAKSFGLSTHHLAKVSSELVRTGFVKSERGRTGGLTLSRPSKQINIGTVVRALKSDTPVVECFGTNKSCKILPVCGLRTPLLEAQEAFFAALDQYSLADVTRSKKALLELIG